MIGVDRGAMIMAPMTVAVESPRTPAEAITAAITSIIQNADRLPCPRGSRSSSRSVLSSSSDRRR